MRRVLFTDKDGTLIEDLPYNVDPARIRLGPGTRWGLQRLGAAGFEVAIVTNQSGVARGYCSVEDLDGVREHLRMELAASGVKLAGFYVCPHLPDGINEYAIECDCRKPLPGMLLRAAAELDVSLRDSWFVGDTWMDVMAGTAAGCRTILVGPDRALLPDWSADRHPTRTAADFGEAVATVLEDAARHEIIRRIPVAAFLA
jgi:D-glycero-D-manno-heptose 1,7-bisphosphate phosphatase